MARPRYVRHRTFDRLRHSKHFLSWLDEQADRLSTTVEAVFDLMVASNLTYEQVEGMDAMPEAPSNTAVPTITGTAQEGQTLTATPGTWDGEPAPDLSYQWYRDTGTEEAIDGETETTYLVAAEDVGATIFVRETAVNASGTASADSAPTDTVVGA